MKKFFYLFVMSFCLGFVSCGNDEEEIIQPPVIDDTDEPKNADLIGWWTIPKEEGFYSYYRLGIHFIDDQIVEYGVLYLSQSWGDTYATTIEGEKYYWYTGSNDMTSRKYTAAYERKGNVIKLSDGWTITFLNGKLNFGYYETREYNKISN